VLLLSIKGQPANDLLRITTSFSHKRTLAKSAETKFVFRNDDRKLLDDPRLLPNTTWEFRYGFFNDLSPVTLGMIREVAPVYEAKVTVTVTLYDALLTAATKSSAKNWGLVPSSDIAKAIAAKHGFSAVVEPSNDMPKKRWIQPNDVNDIRFLRDLAVLIDYEVYVTGSPATLTFRKKRYGAAPKATLTYYSDATEHSYVKSFRPKVKSLGPAQAGMASTDHEKGAGVKDVVDDHTKGGVGIAATNNLSVSPSGAQLYVQPKADVSTPVPSGLNTKALATVARQQMLDKCNEATSDHPLTASITPGDIFVWAGIEKQLAGKWYCFEEHSQISGTSSSTSCQWKRNAMGKGGEKLANTNNADAGGQPPYVGVMVTNPAGDAGTFYNKGTPPTRTTNPQPVPKR
jgi:phage protein D